jgi:deoxyribose-phosphate aldolase
MSALADHLIHLLIEPQLTRADVERACTQAAQHQIYAVMLEPYHVDPARRFLKESRVKIIALIGSPQGGTSSATKMFETQDALQRGADEIAMAINFHALRDREDLLVQNDVAAVVQTARGRPVTLIVENFLSVEEKTRACRIADKARAAFVQTSLGTTDYEMTLANLKIMSVASKIPVVASGKIDSTANASTLLQSGAVRIASSDPERILSLVSNL